MLGERISAAAASGVTERPSRRPLQTVQGFASFLTQKDMLEDQGVHSSVKLQCVVSRCVGLGMHLPSEPTVKHIIATCIDLGLQAADSASKYRLLTEFKTQLKSRVKHAPKLLSHLHLVKYPADPLSLPEALRSTAYGRLTVVHHICCFVYGACVHGPFEVQLFDSFALDPTCKLSCKVMARSPATLAETWGCQLAASRVARCPSWSGRQRLEPAVCSAHDADAAAHGPNDASCYDATERSAKWSATRQPCQLTCLQAEQEQQGLKEHR